MSAFVMMPRDLYGAAGVYLHQRALGTNITLCGFGSRDSVSTAWSSTT